MPLSKKWNELTWVAFDTETTGKYPLDAEVCEIAAVKWQGGKIVDQFQSLCRISKPMGAEVIAIHNITNEMVADAPPLEKVLRDFHKFIDGSILIAHHAPFDLGFLTYEFEKHKLTLPEHPTVCTSLLARKVIIESPNHRLQTLISHLKLAPRTAHRALSDAEGCLDVAIKCFEKLGEVTLGRVCEVQTKTLNWADYSIDQLWQKVQYRAIVEALKEKDLVQIEYMGGSQPGQKRTVKPIGLVRSPDQDFLVAEDKAGEHPKRFFLDKIRSSVR